MHWYLAKIVFKINPATKAVCDQFDEQLTLIEAVSEEEALLKARISGIQEEAKSLADITQHCKWEFVNVAELVCLPRFQDGIELYSRVHETTEGPSYINYVHHKAAALQRQLV
jgi:hypothetical protein